MMFKAQTEGYKCFVPTDKAVEEFVTHADTFHERTIWGTKCRSWFKGGMIGPKEKKSELTKCTGKEDGHVLTHPGSRLHNIHAAMSPRYEDWEWTPISMNRFAFWGNGLTTFEIDENKKDKTWFLTDPDSGYETLIY